MVKSFNSQIYHILTGTLSNVPMDCISEPSANCSEKGVACNGPR